MRPRAIFGVLIVSLLSTGCFDSKPPSPPPQAEIPIAASSQDQAAERDTPERDLVDSSDVPNDPPDATVTTPIPTEADAQTQLEESVAAENDSSLKEMAASVGRVLFGQRGDRSSNQTTDEDLSTENQQHSVLGAVGRALSKAAMEAAKRPPADE